jgi:hypothetical protein
MNKTAIDADYISEILSKHKYAPNPAGLVSPHPLEENDDLAWVDINSLAVRQGAEMDEVPNYPIRIRFQKVRHPLNTEYVLLDVKELTKDEAAKSKAMSRQHDEKKKFGPWPIESV